jgi:hypothetical protein
MQTSSVNHKVVVVLLELAQIYFFIKSIFKPIAVVQISFACKPSNNNVRLGVDLDHAYQWSRSRKGGWAIAQSPILNTSIAVARLTQRGYESLLTHYHKVSPHYQSSPLFGY